MKTDKEIINLLSKEFSILQGFDPKKVTITQRPTYFNKTIIEVWFDLDTDEIETNRLYEVGKKLGELDDIRITAIRLSDRENLRIQFYLRP